MALGIPLLVILLVHPKSRAVIVSAVRFMGWAVNCVVLLVLQWDIFSPSPLEQPRRWVHNEQFQIISETQHSARTGYRIGNYAGDHAPSACGHSCGSSEARSNSRRFLARVTAVLDRDWIDREPGIQGQTYSVAVKSGLWTTDGECPAGHPGCDYQGAGRIPDELLWRRPRSAIGRCRADLLARASGQAAAVCRNGRRLGRLDAAIARSGRIRRRAARRITSTVAAGVCFASAALCRRWLCPGAGCAGNVARPSQVRPGHRRTVPPTVALGVGAGDTLSGGRRRRNLRSLTPDSDSQCDRLAPDPVVFRSSVTPRACRPLPNRIACSSIASARDRTTLGAS